MDKKIIIFIRKIFLHFIMNNPLCTSKIRRGALILCGAKIGKGTFIGTNVYFDPLAISNITIGENCFITQNCSILTHFYSLDRKFYFDKVTIGDNVFLGMNSLICKPVKIGNKCIVGGGSVITHDLPDNCFAAGVPCKIIKEDAYGKEKN